MANEKEKFKVTELARQAVFESRTVLFFSDMNPELSKSLSEQLLALAHLSDDPIKLIINSPGGHVESGDTIFDLIRFIRPKVYVIGSGYVASIATHIFLSVDKEQRFCLPNTRFLIHQPSGGMQGQVSDMHIQAEEIIRTKRRINTIIAEQTGQPYEKVVKDTERDFWMSPDEAIEYGLLGRVINHIDEI